MNGRAVPVYDEDGITLFCADCRDILPHLSGVDLVLTDPPYGIAPGALFRRKNLTVHRDETAERYIAAVDGWRTKTPLQPSATIVEFTNSAIDGLFKTLNGHDAAGWTPWRLFNWTKSTPAPTRRATFVASFELAVMSRVGTPRFVGSGWSPDAFISRSPGQDFGTHRLHPAEKPIGLMRYLVHALAGDGAIILDPFAGSGSTLVAARLEGRRAIGIEIDPKYCQVAIDRLRQRVLPLWDEAS